MRVLLLGGTGILGTALRRACPSDVLVHAPTRADVNLTDVEAVEQAVRRAEVDWVVNAAAYTAVDAAESHESDARRLNADLPAALGREAAARGIPVLHVSTDYVFSGLATRPWREDDACSPASAYGRTKREGEMRLLESGASALILRTAWLYGATGKSFPRTMWDRARRGEPARVVADQHGAPTSAADLASWCWTLVRSGERGLMHAANAGSTTWADVADRVYAGAGLADAVTRVSSADFASAAPRPRYSVLDGRRLDAALLSAGVAARRSWEDALDQFISELAAEVRT